MSPQFMGGWRGVGGGCWRGDKSGALGLGGGAQSHCRRRGVAAGGGQTRQEDGALAGPVGCEGDPPSVRLAGRQGLFSPGARGAGPRQAV